MLSVFGPGFKLGHKGRCFDAYKCPDPGIMASVHYSQG